MSTSIKVQQLQPQRQYKETVINLLNTLTLWNERYRQRQQLAQIDQRMLQDIGKSRCDAVQEADKPFWRS